jgi:signal recognition particle subunit SRP54
LGSGRRRRIALGSGTKIEEVNRLLKQFEDTRKVMKQVAGGGAKNALRAMKGLRRR